MCPLPDRRRFDDNRLYFKDFSRRYCDCTFGKELQADLDRILLWSKDNKLPLNLNQMRYHAHHCLAPTFDPSNTFPEPSGDPKYSSYPPPRCHHRPAFRFPSLRPKRRVRGKVTPWLRHSVHKKSQSRCAQIAVHSTAVAHPGVLLLGVGFGNQTTCCLPRVGATSRFLPYYGSNLAPEHHPIEHCPSSVQWGGTRFNIVLK